jgi:hypothetical protein
MQLGELKTEVLAHGFDPTQFGASRIVRYINDGQAMIARRIDYYVDEASTPVVTSAGVATFSVPSDIGRSRDLIDTDLSRPLQAVALKYIDSSYPRSGTPLVYALDGINFRLFPTPDGVHNLLFRYWKLPTDLVNDTDIPSLPVDFHQCLWMYAVAQSYKSEDDFTMGQQWMNDFTLRISQLAYDLKSINGDAPTQAQSMWQTTTGQRRSMSVYPG